MEGQLKDVEANVTRTNVMSIESGQQVEKSQKQQEYVTASAHAVDKDSWQLVGLLLVTGFNCAYVLSFSNLMLVPLGWAWGLTCLATIGAFAFYANWLLAGFHVIDGHRFNGCRDIMGYVFGRRMFYITWGLQFVTLILDKIYRKMGEGTFGQVLECWDREKREMVAIKIIRAVDKYREAAMIEIDVLEQLRKQDNAGSRCVQIRNWFDYRNHICIVFEKLGPSLYDFLRKNGYRPFPIDLVRVLGRQLLESIAFMHDLHLIHTDLKPENILFVSPEYIKVSDYKVDPCSIRLPKSSAIKVIDFGSTTYESQNQSYVASTRHYRAPEVILGLGWSYPCDIWSVGCILVELCSGEALFQTHENLEHLAMMERVLGPLPQHLLRGADWHVRKYVRRGRLDWPEGAATRRESIKAVSRLPRLQNLVMQHVDHTAGDLIDLLKGLLKYEPSERLRAQEALRHPFFTRNHSWS